MHKHLTRVERESRRRAEAGLRRGKRVTLRIPAWLNDEARIVWGEVRRSLRGLELLDRSDVGMLGMYCDIEAKYRKVSRLIDLGSYLVGEDGKPVMVTDEMVKQAQAWARLAASYAEKLGLTPQGKARLARKRAEEPPKDPLEELLDDVQDYMDEQDGSKPAGVAVERPGDG